jgi:ADP-glucose pyrophosphorylase
MSDIQQVSVAMQLLVDIISMVTNSTLLSNSTVANSTLLRNSTVANSTLLRNSTVANSTLLRNNTGANSTYYATIPERSQLWKQTAISVGSAEIIFILSHISHNSGLH